MGKITITQCLGLPLPSLVHTYGRIDKVRDHKSFVFVILRFKTDFIQIIVNKNLVQSIGIKPEALISVQGELVANTSVKLHQKEIIASEITIINSPIEELPLSREKNNYPTLEHRLDYRWISLREPKFHLVFEIISYFETELRKYLIKLEFIEIHTPKLLGAPSESGAELFELDYFDTQAYLAQSPQFYKQMAIAAGFNKVMEIGPLFRAEPSFTTRHNTEFTGLDFEFGFIEDHYDIMKFEEELLCEMILMIKKQYGKKIEEIFNISLEIPTLPFPKIKFADVVEILKQQFDHIMLPNEDISSEGEKLIAQYVAEKYKHDFVFIIDYPIDFRAFYHMRHSDNPTLTKSFDLLYKGLEITTGAQREHRYDILTTQALEKGLTLEKIQFYLNFFKHGIPPHGGLGIGFMRIFMKMLNLNNIREVTLLPRDPKRLFP